MFMYLCPVSVSVSMCAVMSNASPKSIDASPHAMRGSHCGKDIQNKLPVSAEERLLALKDAVSTLVARERACVSAAKHLRLHVDVLSALSASPASNPALNPQQIVCDMQGGFGRVVCQNEIGDDLGLPDDTYTLSLSGKDIIKAEVLRRGKFSDHLELRQASPGQWHMNVKEGLNQQLLVHLHDGQTLHFDFLSAQFAEDDPTAQQNGKIHLHWMAPIADDVQAVSLAAASVAKASAVCVLNANNATEGDMQEIVSFISKSPKTAMVTAAELHEDLVSLNRKLTRVLETAQKVNDRYVVTGDDGWYDLFSPGGGVLKQKSVMRVTSDDAFIQNDLLQLQENVSLVLAQVRKLGEQELVYEHGDIDSIVRNLALHGEREQHIVCLEKLQKMRQDLLGVVSNAIYADKKYMKTHKLDSVVNRRAHFISLACVDAGLRAQVRLLSGMPMQNCALDVDMGAYQMRQIMANNEHNDIKLDVSVAESCLQKVLSVQSLMQTNMQKDRYELDYGSNEHVLIGAIRVQKILHCLTKKDCINISTGFNHCYRTDLNYCTAQPTHSKHFNQMDIEMKKNKLHHQCMAPEAQTVLLGMLDADLRHRIISPLVHKHVRQAIYTAQEGKACMHADNIVNIFDNDIQLLAKLALGIQESADSERVYEFLQKTDLRTGYNDTNKTTLLINLCFNR